MNLENRAYAAIVVKAVDDGRRKFTGWATTPALDRVGDTVNPLGAKFKNPVSLLHQHYHDRPVGTVTFKKPTAKGIEFEAEMPIIDEPGPLKDRVDTAWGELKHGLVRAVSIGFRPIKYSFLDSGGVDYQEIEIYELSVVSVPALPEAVITSVKSMSGALTTDAVKQIKSADKLRAASGHERSGVVRLDTPPGASGSSKSNPTPKPQEGSNMNIQEQIASFTAQRAAKAAKMDEIMKKSGESGSTLDAASEEEYDTAASEIATIDKHLARLHAHQKSLAATAVPVPGVTVNNGNQSAEDATKAAGNARAGNSVIVVERKLPPGVAFARLAGVIAASKGSHSDAERIVKDRFPDDQRLHNVVAHMDRIKAAVDIGTTTDTDYASPLVQYRDLTEEFIDWLRPQTIVGKITNFRQVPFNVSVPRQTSGGSASWVGEGAPKPVTQFAFDNVTLGHTKLASIAVISQELARFSKPSAEMLIRDSLAGAIIQQLDSDFINPANAGTANVKPASITNGVSAIPSSGSTEDNVRTDIAAVFAPFIAANLTPQNGVWIMSATNALSLSLMVNPLGQTAFPGITMNGGTFWGMPVIVSEAVGNIVVLANARDILVADDGEVVIDASNQASVQMDSAPTNPPVAATVFVSLWQMNLLGIRAEKFINWVKGRAASVQYLSGVAWGAPTSP